MSDHPAAQLIPPGERVLLDMRPGMASIFLRPLATVLVPLALSALGAWILQALADSVGRGNPDLALDLNRLSTWAGLLGVAFAAVRLLWEVLFWFSCRFVLTDTRAIRVFGVVSRQVADLPLRNIQHLTLSSTVRERAAGLGTIGIRTSGGAFPEVYWWMVARPAAVLARVRTAIDAASPSPNQGGADSGRGPSAEQASPGVPSPAPTDPRPLIIGLAGGVGSGKSAVAGELERLGALAIDSDQESRAALNLPHVREELVRWWGPRVLDSGGRIDRGAVAAIVFADPGERRRLESLVHPIVKATRAEIVERAARAGRRTVVVDAPLLFEAGVDKECDSVVFVEAPEALRLSRVQASRGWDASELARRENAQLPLEEKRRRADDVVINDAGRTELAARVRDLLDRIQRRGPRRSVGAGVRADA